MYVSNIIIAIFTVIIAASTIVQALISQRQYKLNLFDKRYKSYLKIKKYIEDVLVDPKKPQHDFIKFKTESMTVSLIFGDEIFDKMNEISKKIILLQQRTYEIEDLDKGPEKVKINLEILEIRKTLCNDIESLKSGIKCYVDLPKDFIISFLWLKEAKWWFLLAGFTGLISLSDTISVENIISLIGVTFVCVGFFMIYLKAKVEPK